MAQELLSTFGTDLGEVSLQPRTGGVFVITYNGEVIWERKTDGRFPDVKQLKQRVRDHLDPDRDLGHLDASLMTKRSAAMIDHRYAGSPGAGSAEVDSMSGQRAFDGSGQSNTWHPQSPIGNGWIGDAPPAAETELEFSPLRALWGASILSSRRGSHAARRS
jgi:selenoprotein W-related protein